MRQYLNQDNRWPRFRRFGLEVDPSAGALSLRRLPGPPRPIARAPGRPTDPPAAAGVAVGRDGSIYLSYPEIHQVFRLDPMSGTARPLARLDLEDRSGRGESAPMGPRGLAYQTCRDRLLIADAPNSRVQLVDLDQERIVAYWGQTWPHQKPEPCGGRGGLDGPEQLACDRAGNVFIVDRLEGARARLVKLNRDGELEKEFDCDSFDPVHVAVGFWRPPTREAPVESVFALALDWGSQTLCLLVFDTYGEHLLEEPLRLIGPDPITPRGAPSEVAFLLPTLFRPGAADELESSGGVTAFTVIDDMAIVALATTPPRVWCFALSDLAPADAAGSSWLSPDPSWLPLYDGPAAALGVRGDPNKPNGWAEMLLFAGPGRDLLALPRRGAFRSQGAFLAGPFEGNRDLITRWRRLRFDGQLNGNGHVKWYTLSRSSASDPWAGPPRPRADRLPSWYRLETQPDLFARLQFALGEETADAPRTDEFNPIRQPGSWAPRSDSNSAAPNQWFAFEENQFDGLTRNDGGTTKQPADQLWIFGLITGDGESSPVFSQASLENDDDGWLDDLPEAYQRNRAGRDLARSMLALLKSRFDDVDEVIDQLPALFSPHAVTARYGRRSPEIDWLRGVLALPERPRMGDADEDRARNIEMFANGPALLARRGSPEGLRQLVRLATGVDLLIDEPDPRDLPQVVGRPAMSDPGASAPGQAPESGAENILGYSSLPDPNDPRPRLPDDSAHHFVALGYESDLIDPEIHQLVETAARRFAPAHLTFTVQTIRPRARLGIQARLGVDAVLAPRHPADPFTLGVPPGPDAQIDPEPPPPTVGSATLNRRAPLL